jgi:flagellar basal-body rod protein FlgB
MTEVETKEGNPVSMKVFDRTMDGLAKSLDMRSQAQSIISANIANADTPGYQAQELDFEASLASALTVDDKMPLARTDSRHIGAGKEMDTVKGEVYNEINDVVREDGNTVDRDDEMNKLYQNQLLFNASADLIKKKLALIKYAITDGGSH